MSCEGSRTSAWRAQAGGWQRAMGDLSGGNKSTVMGVAVMCVSV